MGPGGGACTVVKAQSRTFPRAMRIYQNGSGINAIQILPKGEDSKLFTLGKASKETDESGAFNFNENEDVMGFFGLVNDDTIGVLGF